MAKDKEEKKGRKPRELEAAKEDATEAPDQGDDDGEVRPHRGRPPGGGKRKKREKRKFTVGDLIENLPKEAIEMGALFPLHLTAETLKFFTGVPLSYPGAVIPGITKSFEFMLANSDMEMDPAAAYLIFNLMAVALALPAYYGTKTAFNEAQRAGKAEAARAESNHANPPAAAVAVAPKPDAAAAPNGGGAAPASA